MTVALPPTALAGVKPVIFGVILKITVLAPVPMGFVMLTSPVTASAGTTTCSDVGVTVPDRGHRPRPAERHFRRSRQVRSRDLQRRAHRRPFPGRTPWLAAAAAPSASLALSVVPSTVVTPIFPVFAPRGTVNCERRWRAP